jgi:hypothetical protein
MAREVRIGHTAHLQTWLVISRQLTAQFTGLNLGVMRSRNTLTGFKAKCKTDGACALLFTQTQKIDLDMSSETQACEKLMQCWIRCEHK